MICRTTLPKIGAAMLTAITLAAVGLPALTSPLGASEGCGTYSFGFPGTRLLNDGISDSAGPYPIDIPGGIYTVTLVAHDHHDTQVGVPTQPGEQYYVTLDSGYASPLSTDIADDENRTTSVFTSQRVEASTAITVMHGGTPGINSVDVICVGFTPHAITDPPKEPPAQDIGDPATVVRPPNVVGPASVVPTSVVPTSVVPEVKGTVEVPQVTPQLAVTGPGAHARTLVGFGTLMIALGALLIRRERRFDIRS